MDDLLIGSDSFDQIADDDYAADWFDACAGEQRDDAELEVEHDRWLDLQDPEWLDAKYRAATLSHELAHAAYHRAENARRARPLRPAIRRVRGARAVRRRTAVSARARRARSPGRSQDEPEPASPVAVGPEPTP